MFLSAGKPIAVSPSPEEIVRFLGKVEMMDLPATRSHGCWKWRGGFNDVYPQFWFRGKNNLAHRLAFQFFVGPLLQAEEVHHRCLNEWCVNPRHLEAMTRPEHQEEHQNLVPVCFLGGPLDSEERHFHRDGIPEFFEIKVYGQTDTYRYDDGLREYVYDGYRRTRKR